MPHLATNAYLRARVFFGCGGSGERTSTTLRTRSDLREAATTGGLVAFFLLGFIKCAPVSAYFRIGLTIRRCFLEGIVFVYTLRRIIFVRALIYTTASVVPIAESTTALTSRMNTAISRHHTIACFFKINLLSTHALMK